MDKKNPMFTEKTMDLLVSSFTELVQMHLDLIGLYEQESKLKKHHRPYLYVREYAEKLCQKNKSWVEEKLDTLLDCIEGRKDSSLEEDVQNNCLLYEVSEEDLKEAEEEEESFVILKEEAFQELQNDMVNLADAVDAMTELFENLLNGYPVEAKCVSGCLSGSRQLADEVLQKWENHKLIKLNG